MNHRNASNGNFWAFQSEFEKLTTNSFDEKFEQDKSECFQNAEQAYAGQAYAGQEL